MNTQEYTEKRRIRYVRTSTSSQNTARQIKGGIEHLIDVCSGAVPFKNRAYGSWLWDNANPQMEIEVEHLDRLGRNVLDILQTVDHLTKHGVNLIIPSQGINTLNPDGTESIGGKMFVTMFGLMAEVERNLILERQKEGIRKAKERGTYKARDAKREPETWEQFISKKANADALKYLKQGRSIRETAKMAGGISTATVQKVLRWGLEVGELSNKPSKPSKKKAKAQAQ